MIGRTGMAEGSTAEVRFFTLRQCPARMCDLPHRSSSGTHSAGENKRCPRYGIIIQKCFLKQCASPTATLPRLAPQDSNWLRPWLPAYGFDGLNRRISVAKQRNGRVLTDQIRPKRYQT